MIPDTTSDPIADQTKIPSTAGMTTKVVKGSLWALGGMVAPLIASLVATPFVIRFLGTEAYGVLVLITLIPAYFTFADLGMGMASTKFASEAYGKGDRQMEGEVVRTSAAMALAGSLVIAVPAFLLSGWIMTDVFTVPEYLQWPASLALKIATVTFVFTNLGNVLNSPLLARLRMDIGFSLYAANRLLTTIITPVVLLYGGGLIGAALVLMIFSVAGLAAVTYASGTFLRELYSRSFASEYVRPIMKFGSGLLIVAIAQIILMNSEKIILTRLLSVRSLAHYSIAFTFANMAALFSFAMVQSLIPAFSQLLTTETKDQFNALFSRSLRLTIIWLLPMLMFLFVIAKPFFTYWAGEEFGRESPLPFYILLGGMAFNILAYIPHSAILAAGRSEIVAKLYWIELMPYIVMAVLLINAFGIAGAAAAWSIRVVADSVALSLLARKIVGASFDLRGRIFNLGFAFAILLIPVVFVLANDNFSLWLILLTPASAAFYSIWIWKRFVSPDEKIWIAAMARNFFRSLGFGFGTRLI